MSPKSTAKGCFEFVDKPPPRVILERSEGSRGGKNLDFWRFFREEQAPPLRTYINFYFPHNFFDSLKALQKAGSHKEVLFLLVGTGVPDGPKRHNCAAANK